MNIKFSNNSTYNMIKIICNNNEYILSDSNRDVNIVTNSQPHINIEILDKNRFIYNLPAILTSSFTHKDSQCYIKCNLEFDIKSKFDSAEILIENDLTDYKNRYFFESVKIIASTIYITNKVYSISNTDTIIKKHKKFNLFVTALFPIVIINFILCFIDKDILFFLFGVIALMLFSIPSIVDIKKFNKICRDTNLVQNLFSNANKRNS